MKARKLLALGLTAIIGATMMAGCGGGGGSTTSQSSDGSSARIISGLPIMARAMATRWH